MEQNLFRKVSKQVRIWIEISMLAWEKPRGFEECKVDTCQWLDKSIYRILKKKGNVASFSLKYLNVGQVRKQQRWAPAVSVGKLGQKPGTEIQRNRWSSWPLDRLDMQWSANQDNLLELQKIVGLCLCRFPNWTRAMHSWMLPCFYHGWSHLCQVTPCAV